MNKAVLLTALAAILMVVLPGPLYQFDVLTLGPAFTILRYGVYVGGAAFLLLLTQLIFFRSSASIASVSSAVLCILVSIGLPLNLMQSAKAVPPIHDITTDVVNPPLFVEVLSARGENSNPPEYLGGKITEQQQTAYPDIKAQIFTATQEDVSEAVKVVVTDLGWELHTQSSDKSTLSPVLVEATHTSSWFGFKDDVAIRIAIKGAQTVVDVRSKSRVGRSDLGANAKRIRMFQSALEKKLL